MYPLLMCNIHFNLIACNMSSMHSKCVDLQYSASTWINHMDHMFSLQNLLNYAKKICLPYYIKPVYEYVYGHARLLVYGHAR